MSNDNEQALRDAIVRWRDATREWDVAKFGGYSYEDTYRRNSAAAELAEATAALFDIAAGGSP